MKKSFASIMLVLIVIIFSELTYSQTIKWTSTTVSNYASKEGWLVLKNNPLEFRFWKFDSQTNKLTIMDGPLSNNKWQEIDLPSKESFSGNYFYNFGGGGSSIFDYNGDGINDLIIGYQFSPSLTGYGIKIIDPTNNQTLFQLGDTTHSYGVEAIYDFDGDGKFELAINRYEYSTQLTDIVVYATNGSATSMNDKFSEIPINYKLKQNYPNPFNPSTTIEYQVAKAGNVSINIYDINGRLIKVLVNENIIPGSHSVIWNGKDNKGSTVASGTYFYQVQAGDFVQAKKMILLK
jgi:hypothetical protein